VAYIVDADERRLREAAPLAPGARMTTSVDQALADPAVDAVVVATPPWVTTRLAAAALEAGKYVLAEKPIAPTLSQAEELRAVAGADERLQIGLTYRHHPAVERLRELVQSDALGHPLLVQATVSDEPANPDGDPDGFARRLRSLDHNPPIVSDGVHACDRLNFVLGASPSDVRGWSLRSDERYAVANANGAVLEYGDGTTVRLEVIWLFPVLPPSQFVVTGPLGSAVLDPQTFALRVELAHGSTEELPPPGGKTEVCFALQLERFLDACVERRPPVPGLEEALASLELAERCARAAGVAAGAAH
jgi:predicted dehydrogenase